MRFKLLSAVCVSVVLGSCFSIKPQASKTGKHLWEDFYVSPEVMQYFIKPLSFKNDDLNIDIDTDFTFRNVSDSVTVNYSIYSKTDYIKPNVVTIANELTQVSVNSPKTIVSENVQKKHKLRQTGKISLNEFTELTKNNIWTITILNENLKTIAYSSQKTRENIEKININLMIPLTQ